MSDGLFPMIVDENSPLSLAELARACRTAEADLQIWVVEGVLQPSGGSPSEWRFAGSALRRARLALRLTRELELNTPGVALAIDLIERIQVLESRLRRVGLQP